MSNPSHTAASHINALARKHYPKRPDMRPIVTTAQPKHREPDRITYPDKTTIPTKAIPISDAAATVRE